jgi:hypothetical protein
VVTTLEMSLHHMWLLNILKVLPGRSYWTAMMCSKMERGSFIYDFTAVFRLSDIDHVYSTAEIVESVEPPLSLRRNVLLCVVVRHI